MSTASPASSSLAEKREERKAQRHTAYIAASSALAGGVVTGLFALWGTHQQIESQASQQKDAFLRSERNDAYAHMLRLDSEQADWSEGQFAAVDNQRRYTQRQVDHYWRIIRQQQTSMRAANAQLSLIGSEPVVTAAKRVAADHYMLTGLVGDLIEEIDYHSAGDRRIVDETLRNYQKYRVKLSKDSPALLEAVRYDIGADSS